MTNTGTNCYLIGSSSDRILIDTGSPNENSCVDALTKFISSNPVKISKIICTHWHPDHTGGVSSLVDIIGNSGRDTNQSDFQYWYCNFSKNQYWYWYCSGNILLNIDISQAIYWQYIATNFSILILQFFKKSILILILLGQYIAKYWYFSSNILAIYCYQFFNIDIAIFQKINIDIDIARAIYC